MAVLEDVTRLVAQERELLADRQRLQAIYAHVQDYAIFTVDLEGRFDKWNPSLLRFGGWSEAEVLGHPLDAFFPPEHQEAGGLRALLADARRTGSVQLEGSRIRADQGRAWASSVISALPDANGDVCGYLVISRDMTERRNMEDELRRLATTDPLTGAFNRRHGQTCIADASRRAARGGLQPAILMLNVDHFKAINDGHGHAVGDDVLRAVAGICRKALGEDVTLVRWGARSSSSCCPARPSSRPPISASRCGWRCKARASRCRGGRSPSRPASGWPPRGAKCRISW
jgi:PAS domain S-box-containing protein